MRAEQELQKMFDEYPDLFCTRQECLDHLFCVIGNGYDWRCGMLVDCRDDRSDAELEEEWQKNNGHDFLRGRKKACQDPKLLKKHEDEKKEWFLDDEDYCKEHPFFAKHGYSWYPLSRYSWIYHIPEDIKPDWKALVDECKAMLKSDGIDIEKIRNH